MIEDLGRITLESNWFILYEFIQLTQVLIQHLIKVNFRLLEILFVIIQRD